MNSDQTEDTLTQLFEQGSVFDKLEKYVSLCLSPRSEESTAEQSDSCEASAAKAKKTYAAGVLCSADLVLESGVFLDAATNG